MITNLQDTSIFLTNLQETILQIDKNKLFLYGDRTIKNKANSPIKFKAHSKISLNSKEQFLDDFPRQQVLNSGNILSRFDSELKKIQMSAEISLSSSVRNQATQCPPGFQSYGQNDQYCQDIDECYVTDSNRNSPCSHKCQNIMGGYLCSCDKGYELDRDDLESCIDVDECTAFDQAICPMQAPVCTNTIGSYTCSSRCPVGFEPETDSRNGNSGTHGCRDIDECLLPEIQNACGILSTCVNTIGSYYCECRTGYQASKDTPEHSCEDIDECSDNSLNNCQPHQTCINLKGSYRCQDICSIGLQSTENSGCLDINECEKNTEICPIGQTCINTIGSYSCSCEDGFTQSPIDPNICVDINECENYQNICQHQCINQPGDFKCKCPTGYKLSADKRQCEDIDECALSPRGICGPGQTCFNRRGDFTCIKTPCPAKNGYKRDRITGKCLKKFSNKPTSPIYEVVYETVALPFGLSSNIDLLKLTAKTTFSRKIHKNTEFIIKVKKKYRNKLPFDLRSDEEGTAILYTSKKLDVAKSYTLRIIARSLKENGKVAYKTTFIIYLAVSKYPY